MSTIRDAKGGTSLLVALRIVFFADLWPGCSRICASPQHQTDPFQVSFMAEVPKGAICVALQLVRKLRMFLLTFDEGTKRRADFGAKSFGKRGTCYEIGAVVQEESDQFWLPTQQDIRKRNRGKFGAALQKKLYKFEMPFRNGAARASFFASWPTSLCASNSTKLWNPWSNAIWRGVLLNSAGTRRDLGELIHRSISYSLPF